MKIFKHELVAAIMEAVRRMDAQGIKLKQRNFGVHQSKTENPIWLVGQSNCCCALTALIVGTKATTVVSLDEVKKRYNLTDSFVWGFITGFDELPMLLTMEEHYDANEFEFGYRHGQHMVTLIRHHGINVYPYNVPTE